MQNTLDTICRALAGILAVTSEASGVPVEDIGWRDLPRTMANRLTPGYPSQTFAVDTRLAAITAAGLGMWAWVEAGAACMNISAALVAQRRGNPTAKPAPADLRTVLDTFRNLWAEV
jgi:hypothetical protein